MKLYEIPPNMCKYNVGDIIKVTNSLFDTRYKVTKIDYLTKSIHPYVRGITLSYRLEAISGIFQSWYTTSYIDSRPNMVLDETI